MMKKILPLLLFPLAALARPEPPPLPAVTIVHPSRAREAHAYELPGRTEPYEAARLATRATGIISERRFDIGDQVEADEVVALVDAPDIDHAVEAARAALLQAEAKARNARQLADRASRLHKERALSREELESRSAASEEVDAAVAEAKARLAQLEAQQGFATVRAPFAGIIAARNFDKGDHVRGDAAAGQAWLYQLVRLDKLRFSVNASPDIALRLPPGITADVVFREFPGRQFKAKVTRSSRVFDTASGTMRVELLLENGDLSLPAGLTGTATFRLEPPGHAYLVPTNALIVRNGKSKLGTVADNKVAFVQVLTGRNLGPQVEVISPLLNEKTAVIINPNAMLQAGQTVVSNPLVAKDRFVQERTPGESTALKTGR